MRALNAELRERQAPYAVERAELLFASTTPAARATAGVVYANVRTRLSEFRWVPGDARRGGRTTITYGSFGPGMLAATPAGGLVSGQAAVDAAAATWNGVSCAKLRLERATLPTHVIPSARLGGGAYVNAPGIVDVGVVGWVPAYIFTAIFGPAAGPTIVGVTFTYAYTTPTSTWDAPVYTDVDRDGRGDVAFKEIWFQNDAPRLAWTTGPSASFRTTGVDAQYAALHELGHAIGLDHFGRLFVNGSGELQGAPFAVMNASGAFSLREPAGSDVSALCTGFAAWPSR
jgi:hypothetical protein